MRPCSFAAVPGWTPRWRWPAPALDHGRVDPGVHLIGTPFPRDQLARKVAEVLQAGETEAGQDATDIVALKSRRID